MITKIHTLLLAALVCCALPAVGQDTPAVPRDAAAPPAEYAIGPKDLLEIRVLEIPELNVERRVGDSGSIDLPLIGAFSVEGLTPRAASDRLAGVLVERYVNRANVSIVVKQYGYKPLSIVGAVANPGSLNVTGRYTLLEAISAAGGLTAQAGKRLYIMRTAANGLSDVLEIKTDDLFHSSSTRWNVPVYPSDIVNVPARTTVKIFCLGEVKAPGALEFDSDDRITLLSVIAKAGGLTDRASRQIHLKHRGPDGKDVESVVNFKSAVSGSRPDPQLSADDIVIVKVSFF